MGKQLAESLRAYSPGDYDQVRDRVSALQQERSSWTDHWQEISRFLMPRAGRFLTTEVNKGGKKYHNIIDSTGIRAHGVLSAGLMSGATSPARPWFRLATSDSELMKSDNVKIWLNEVKNRILDVMQRSNTYRSLHMIYEELGAFGVAASIPMPDFNRVIHHYPLTIGQYSIGSDYKGEVNTLERTFSDTVENIVREFGYRNCSTTVRNAYDKGNYMHRSDVVHVIQPRQQRDATKRDNINMPYQSCYYEKGGNERKFLRESGFERFPPLAPRWVVTAGDTYGHSPGMEALGDLKQLQHQQLRKGQAIDYQVNPPLSLPTVMKNRDVERFPGGLTYTDSSNPIRSMFEVNLNLNHLTNDIMDVRQRINEAFFKDIFMMIAAGSQTTMKTATEIAERHEEKMLMLGPVLERLHNELLSPLIDLIFDRLVEANLLPPPPEEMQGQELKIEFVSILAQAQRAVNAAGLDRFVTSLGSVSAIKPEVLDKLDADEWVDAYADMFGVDPRIITPDAEVVRIRDGRAKAMQAQAQQAENAQLAETAEKLSKARTDQPSALSNVMSQFSGYNT